MNSTLCDGRSTIRRPEIGCDKNVEVTFGQGGFVLRVVNAREDSSEKQGSKLNADMKKESGAKLPETLSAKTMPSKEPKDKAKKNKFKIICQKISSEHRRYHLCWLSAESLRSSRSIAFLCDLSEKRRDTPA